jgi:hypothetical protein
MVFGGGFMRGNPFDQLTDIMRGYGQVLREAFSSPQVQALVSWMAAQSGPPPGEPFSAPLRCGTQCIT